ncbi:DUF92 domain-containing protein [Salinilacihabitans rarus]|uniref:DUF92 domain-containing protein n=1 Tax=Salinilacihabitans rarus TaxID=2961596 RepID=UPI0020C8966D|nr:DUF92 domain-containing protein [Salinilacihabitans rarus]
MTASVRRAGAFAALSTLSLAAPLFGPVPAATVAAAALLVALAVTDGPLFDLFAFPSDYEDGRLYGLLTFVLAAATLGLVATRWPTMDLGIFVGTVLLIGYGVLAERVVAGRTDADVPPVAAFTVVGLLAAVGGQAASRALVGAPIESALPEIVFLAASGALLAALLRDVLISYDDPIVMLAVGLVLWLLAALEPAIGTTGIALALAVTVAMGSISYVLGAASVTGMLTGTLLALLTIVLGGYDWFAVLISFFAIGSLSTKIRYEEKADRGVAEDNDGARGGGNVLGNSAVALAAVVGYAASSAGFVPGAADLFLFAFAGSVATAMSDTLSSEIGGIFDSPRLITTLEPVEPGTDGGVTWQGELAGLAGASVVAAICYAFFPEVDAAAAAVVVAAGVVGMTVDSILGATLEGSVLGNQGVNFLATLAGAFACALLVLSAAMLG